MHERTKNLLIELYALDPSLKEHEPALVAVLERMTAAKPDVRIDQAFLAELRETLLAVPATTPPRYHNIITNLFDTMSKTPFILGGLAMTAVLVAVVATLPGQAPSGTPTGSQLAMLDGIVDTAPGAFGNIGALGLQGVEAPSVESVSTDTSAPAAEPIAVLGTPAAISARPQSGGGGGLGMGSDAKMSILPWYPSPAYDIVYEGAEPIEIAEQSVYRRSTDQQTLTAFAAAVTGRQNGLIDLSRFRDLRIERISLFEDRAGGYQTELNLFDGSLYMNLDWRHQQYDPAMDRQIPLSELPSDTTFIDAANAFMDRFGIDRAVYGEPVVDTSWQRYVIMADSAEASYAPSMVSVVYPLLVDDMQVTEFGGEIAGPRVHIRVQDLTVMNLGNLTTRRFERSAYALELDVVRLVAFAEKGGIRGSIHQPMSYDDQGNPVTPTEPMEALRLGEPEQVLMKMYHSIDNVSVELYLPALRFPILNVPQGPDYYGPRDVMVPLVKDILDEAERMMDQQPVPMPLDLPAVSEPAVLR